MTSNTDRRTSRRFPAVQNLATLEWTDGLSNRTSRARVINVSQGGALLEGSLDVKGDEILWLRLDEPATTGWVGARVVRQVDQEQAAVAFLEPCPFDFLQSATLGIGLNNLY